ncbi:MAG: hypothetical protein ACE5D2_00260 [Fidelibacterota bacterium]
MFKFLLYGTLVYLAYKLYRGVSVISKQGKFKKEQTDTDPYKKLDIRDADYEDVNEDENKSG